MRAIPIAATPALGLLLLAACDPPGDEAGPAPSSTETVSATPTVSIIRPDVVASPIVDLPPEPLTATIGFPEGGAELDAAARGELDRLLASDQIGEGWPVVLRGHSDSVGHDGDNLVVSRRRAEAVADYLTAHGVAEGRITVIALGEQNPIAANAHPDGTPDEQGRARNRRVEIDVAPPGEPPDEGDAGPAVQTPAGSPSPAG